MVFAAVHDALRSPGVVTTPALSDSPRVETERPGAERPLGSGVAMASGAQAQAGLFGEAAAPYARSLFGRVLGQVQETFVIAFRSLASWRSDGGFARSRRESAEPQPR